VRALLSGILRGPAPTSGEFGAPRDETHGRDDLRGAPPNSNRPGLGMIRVEFGQPMGRRWDRDLQCGHLSPLPSARRDSLRCIPAMRRTPVHTSLPRPCTGVPSPLVRPTLAGALRSGTPRSTEARNRWVAGIFPANHNQSRFYPGLGANREAAGHHRARPPTVRSAPDRHTRTVVFHRPASARGSTRRPSIAPAPRA
jgi:hypothetical protein